MASIQCRLRCAYVDNRNCLAYDPTQQDNQVWARGDNSGLNEIWTVSNYRGDPQGPWIFSQGTGNWRMCTVGKQLCMSLTDATPYSALWWIEQYADARGHTFFRLKSGAQNNLYVALPQVVGVPWPNVNPCVLSDTPRSIYNGTECQWYPEPADGGGGGNPFPPPRAG